MINLNVSNSSEVLITIINSHPIGKKRTVIINAKGIQDFLPALCPPAIYQINNNFLQASVIIA